MLRTAHANVRQKMAPARSVRLRVRLDACGSATGPDLVAHDEVENPDDDTTQERTDTPRERVPTVSALCVSIDEESHG